jgi:hypothetical protein
LVQHQLERSIFFAMIVGSAIDGIIGCTVVHRLEPYDGVLFRASRSCGRYQFPRGCCNLLLVPSVKASWRSLTKSFHTVEFGLAWLG